MSGFSQRLSDFGYAAGWRLARLLPESAGAVTFGLGADLAVRRDGGGVRQLRRNLARVVPQADGVELDELTRRAMRSYARYWHEMFRLPSMDHKEVSRKVAQSITGVENLDAALAEGNGAVMALPHSGNWDAAGVWLADYLGGFTTVAERLKPESLYQRFVSYRESLGFEIVPLTGDSSAMRVLLKRLRENKAICLVGDRDLTNSGVPVKFFGEQTRMPGGPARLAATTGAALIPAGCWFTEDGWQIRLHPRIRVTNRSEVPAATQALADIFAGDIAAHPADWHMMQKFWLSDFEAGEQAELGEAS
ncbi:phosphatidylinositol mannoside acyltransferase [Amycolatopsis sp. WAC 01375]|uniref:phosphatidylinositol mannoside acyltransferase n=1 Tax=unclassified Amycolatopsis TaxID=2618356 RepID=UPI000F79DDBC|nr:MULTISPECIES: phosphatidylinositol mannoside acyltransferase [unclassified Amycolatopsis]RSM53516.1 phosphatidylinositol mannoside acyltransferase [Amycolatopsis sp. WAC 01376]RSM73338.1 phosphatidylinositol mannoside acyltransferase [Amycolatopsis sp. WAC 01375]RSN22776.1 phosphatidylinositol mannoside acyltransferase [Amycolatopsis sp. WAC 01416]